MTLDLAQVIDAINNLVVHSAALDDARRFEALRVSWSTLESAEIERRLAGARTSFLVARTEGEFRGTVEHREQIENYTVIATDGSTILPSRHSPARFYVLNIGSALLRYGSSPGASLQSQAALHFGDDEMTVPNDLRRLSVNESILGLRRSVAELEAALDLAGDSTCPVVALQDGTLILWRLESQSDSVRNWILPDFVDALVRFRDLDVPIASYVSAPASTDVMNALRINVCDYPSVGRTINCDHCRGRIALEGHTPACDILPSITDRSLLSEIAGLAPGSRTAVFRGSSRIIGDYVALGGSDAEICFFYANVGREIVRIETPRWVTNNPNHLDLVHSIVQDQCRLGFGYPVVLQEAHEQAVIGMEDRRIVELAVERALARAGIVLTWTGKDGSKRGRFV